VAESEDQRLIRELRTGRPEACAELVDTHYQRVYRFLAHLTRDIHRAEDLTQETFAAAWQNIVSFESRAALATWLHRIAYTKFIDSQRAERRSAVLREQFPGAEARHFDPLDTVIADDDTRRLYQALQALGEADRTIIVLHYLQELSYRDMAAVLDEPSGTVKWRTSEALNRLRLLLIEGVFDHETRKMSS
jgi:RNA polymerase sigma-70 factor, ECF subfamily